MQPPPLARQRFLQRPLRCPHSGVRVDDLLAASPAALIRDGSVLDLAREAHYWNHLPEEQMTELLRVTRDAGWREALDRVFRPRVDDYTYAYATDQRRADAIALCELDEGSTVVDVGAGWGAVTMALADAGHTVFALDSNVETLEFVSRRSEQEGIGERVIAVRIDALEKAPLPFEDGAADLLLLNGVLEWVGAGVEEGSPLDHQRRVLADARRVLRSGGTLFLAIESRWGLSMLLGGEDHPGTRFTSIVPRRLASWMTRRKGKGDYRTWTHGHRALRRLLGEAGFGDLRFYSPFPDYRFPHSVVPLEHARLFARTIRRPGLSPGHARLLRWSAMLGLHRDAVSHFCVVARP